MNSPDMPYHGLWHGRPVMHPDIPVIDCSMGSPFILPTRSAGLCTLLSCDQVAPLTLIAYPDASIELCRTALLVTA